MEFERTESSLRDANNSARKRRVLFRANAEDWSGVIRTAGEVEYESSLRARAEVRTKIKTMCDQV